MALMSKVRQFFANEDGMVTVEWVALSAAVVVGGIAIAWGVLEQMDGASGTIGTHVEGALPEGGPTQPTFGDGLNGDG